MLTRATFESANDNPKLSEISVNVSHGEKARGVEFMQPYGLSTVPISPKSEGGSKRRAEVLMLHADDQRSHPIAFMVADRRFRPRDMQEGEVQVHDDQGQKVHLTRDGIVVSSAKKLTLKVGDNGSISIDAAGVITIRGSAVKFEQA